MACIPAPGGPGSEQSTVKTALRSVDARLVDDTTLQWISYGMIAAVALLGSLHILTSLVRNETYLHDTKVAVAELREKYTQELMALHGIKPSAPDQGAARPSDAPEAEGIELPPEADADAEAIEVEAIEPEPAGQPQSRAA